MIKLSQGLSFEEIEEFLADGIFDLGQEDMPRVTITPTVASVVAEFHPRGEEFRDYVWKISDLHDPY